MIEKIIRVNALYDFYQPLLTQKQQEYLDLHYLNDFSLGEIAERCHVSRQAVHDHLKRAERALEDFEEKLGLYQKYQTRMRLIADLRKQSERMDASDRRTFDTILDRLENIG